MSVGDMFVVLVHVVKTRYDEKMQCIVAKTEYFIPCAKNSYEDAKSFADSVKGAYHADIMQLWNPRQERTCQAVIPDEMKGYVFCSECGAEIGEYSRPNYCPSCGAKVVM